MKKLKNIKIIPVINTYADCAFWGVGTSKNGQVFLGVSTHNPYKSAEIFRYDPVKLSLTKVVDIGKVVVSKKGVLPQGKIHTPLFCASDGWLYFATHFAYPCGKPQPINYKGGHWMRLDPKTGNCQDLGIGMENEGIVTMIMDTKRLILYGLSAPNFSFLVFDIRSGKTRNLGKIANGSICRTMTIDDKGNVYGSFENNKIFEYKLSKDTVNVLSTRLQDSLINTSEWEEGNKRGVNHTGRAIWRTVVWNDKNRIIYGIHARDSTLFSFSSNTLEHKTLVTLCSDRFLDCPGNVYPTLSLLCSGLTLFYAPAEGLFDYRISEKISGMTHLVSFDIVSSVRTDYGEITDTNNGRKVYGVGGGVIGKNGNIFYVGAVEILSGELYHRANLIEGKPYCLGLIHIKNI